MVPMPENPKEFDLIVIGGAPPEWFAPPTTAAFGKTVAVVDSHHELGGAGAGVIGSEYACTFTALGTEVHVLDGRDALLSFLDAGRMGDKAVIHALRGRGSSGPCSRSIPARSPLAASMAFTWR